MKNDKQVFLDFDFSDIWHDCVIAIRMFIGTFTTITWQLALLAVYIRPLSEITKKLCIRDCDRYKRDRCTAIEIDRFSKILGISTRWHRF